MFVIRDMDTFRAVKRSFLSPLIGELAGRHVGNDVMDAVKYEMDALNMSDYLLPSATVLGAGHMYMNLNESEYNMLQCIRSVARDAVLYRLTPNSPGRFLVTSAILSAFSRSSCSESAAINKNKLVKLCDSFAARAGECGQLEYRLLELTRAPTFQDIMNDIDRKDWIEIDLRPEQVSNVERYILEHMYVLTERYNASDKEQRSMLESLYDSVTVIKDKCVDVVVNYAHGTGSTIQTV